MEFDINEEDLFALDKSFKLIKNPIKNSTKRVVKEKYDQIILEKFSNLDENLKPFLYNKLKNEIKLEDYLSTLKIFNSRISHHKLEIEIGRYKKVPREQRICKACKVLDDEKHLFLYCHINYNIRNRLIQEIENYYPDYNQLDSIAKLKIILNPSPDILSNVVDYIKQSMELWK